MSSFSEHIEFGIAYEMSIHEKLVYAFLFHSSNAESVSKCSSRHIAASLDLELDDVDASVKALEEMGLIETYTHPVQIAQIGKLEIAGVAKSCVIKNRTTSSEQSRLSASEWAGIRSAVFERDDYTCAYCDKRGGKLECDHVEPISRGGTNEMGNLVTACQSCNRKKRSKLISEWKIGEAS